MSLFLSLYAMSLFLCLYAQIDKVKDSSQNPTCVHSVPTTSHDLPKGRIELMI